MIVEYENKIFDLEEAKDFLYDELKDEKDHQIIQLKAQLRQKKLGQDSQKVQSLNRLILDLQE